jgi:hypothetical protein
VRYVRSSENRAAGAVMGAQLRPLLLGAALPARRRVLRLDRHQEQSHLLCKPW